MSWREFLQKPQTLTAPWLGQPQIYHGGRRYRLEQRPTEQGWFQFEVSGRNARVLSESTAPENLSVHLRGYLVGNRLIPDGFQGVFTPEQYLKQTPQVFLTNAGEKFRRVACTRWEGFLLLLQEEFPLGPEEEVLKAFQERTATADIRGVTPALRMAYDLEVWLVDQREKYGQEVQRLQAEEHRRQERALLAEQVVTGAGRRRVAPVDFEVAARAALRVSGSDLLDWTPLGSQDVRVSFRFRGASYRCVVDRTSLGILDAGVCLNGSDRLYTLESLPAVIGEALDSDVLHIF